MKRRSFKTGLIAGVMSLAGILGLGQVAQASAPANYVNKTGDLKAGDVKNVAKKLRVTNTICGVPITRIIPNYGMSPKEYGMRFGHGNSKGKVNKLRLSHNAKLKRR